MRYAQKFVVVGLVLLIPLGFVAGAYIDLQREQIAFSAKERDGVEFMAPLIELTGHVVEARHRAVTPADDGDPDLTGDLAGVDALDRRYGSTLHTTQPWQTARRLILSAERAGGSAATRFETYNAATDALLTLIVHVGDESNLTLDPDLDTYYLMDTLQFRLPVLLNTAGRSVDRATLAAIDPDNADTDAFIDLGLDAGVVTNTHKVLARAVETVAAKTASTRIGQTTVEHFDRLDGETALLAEALTAAVKGHRLDAVAVGVADSVRAAAVSFARTAAASLDELLRLRIARFSARAQRVGIGAGVAGLLAIYLFVGFYLSVASPIRRIVETLHAVAGGDLSRRVHIDTHDELSFVGTALNETVARTQVATDRLALQASRDSLTGLPNRGVVLDRLECGLARAQRTGTLMAVLFIDLDRFKIINDSYGHEAGDDVLRAVAERLQSMVRSSDTVARLAGDEFVVISEDLTDLGEAVAVADRVVEAVCQPIITGSGNSQREANIGASVGIAFADATAAMLPEDLLRDADVAMYRAKQRGRGRVEIFDDALRIAIERRLQCQDELRRGIETGQLRVHYQPVVDTDASRVVGFEALARWQHPTRGLLGAADFVDVAEEAGLIIPLGAEILAQACHQTAVWRATRPGCERLHIAINVSGPQFSHPSFVPTVRSVLDESGLDPDALWLEITETSIMTDAETVQSTLHALRALGVHLAIDDFGTGYSSLAYLRRFPVEVLKIDRSFVAGLGHDREEEAIVAMIVGLAQTLGLLLIAEGVETATQLELVRRLGCSTVQGYYFGRPAAAEHAWDNVIETRQQQLAA